MIFSGASRDPERALHKTHHPGPPLKLPQRQFRPRLSLLLRKPVHVVGGSSATDCSAQMTSRLTDACEPIVLTSIARRLRRSRFLLASVLARKWRAMDETCERTQIRWIRSASSRTELRFRLCTSVQRSLPLTCLRVSQHASHFFRIAVRVEICTAFYITAFPATTLCKVLSLTIPCSLRFCCTKTSVYNFSLVGVFGEVGRSWIKYVCDLLKDATTCLLPTLLLGPGRLRNIF